MGFQCAVPQIGTGGLEATGTTGASVRCTVARRVWTRHAPRRGCAVTLLLGGQVFLHNAHLPNTPDANPKSDWSDPRQETLISPSIDKRLFEQSLTFDSTSALRHFRDCKHSPGR
jgi:hypothetical protein